MNRKLKTTALKLFERLNESLKNPAAIFGSGSVSFLNTTKSTLESNQSFTLAAPVKSCFASCNNNLLPISEYQSSQLIPNCFDGLF